MFLKQLKIAGFKSFVESTDIVFQHPLIGIVGPNGCGKSNLIDAMRWVLGESLAKNLRGENMTDVIFSGTNTRKSVGMAYVELIVNNQHGVIQGPLSGYQDISLKRMLSRDGESHYFLNGQRCRRKDIQDLFLGTGAGTKGYAIIGQDQVTRLVEARPQELKSFIEEAAGVSKYKERRKESVQKITQTRDNLVRVGDIRNELNQQMEKLERQARAAKRYTTLKEQERSCKKNIYALKNQQYVQELEQLKQKRVTIDQISNQQKQDHVHLSEKRQRQQAGLIQKQAKLHQTQQQLLQIDFECKQLEESLQQQQYHQDRIQQDEVQYQDQLNTLLTQEAEQTAQLTMLLTHISMKEEEQHQIKTAYKDALSVKKEEETQVQAALLHWQSLQTQWQEASQQHQRMSLALEHARQQQADTLRALEAVHDELLQLSQESLPADTIDESGLVLLQQRYEAMQTELAQLQDTRATIKGNVEEHKTSMKTLEHALQRIHLELAPLLATYHSGQSSQAPALSVNYPRVVEVLQIEEAWLAAIDWILNAGSRALMVPTMEEAHPLIANALGNHGFATPLVEVETGSTALPRLCDKIRGPIPNWPIRLDKIFTAKTLAEALSWIPKIKADESILLAEKIWLGKGWIQIHKQSAPQEEQLLSIKNKIVGLEQQVEEASLSLETIRTSYFAEEEKLKETQLAIESLQSASVEQKLAVLSYAQKMEQEQKRMATVSHAILKKNQESDVLKNKQLNGMEKIETLLQQTSSLQATLSELDTTIAKETTQKEAIEARLHIHQRQVDELQQMVFTIEGELKQMTLEAASLKKNIQQDERVIASLQARLATLKEEKQRLMPLTTIEAKMNTKKVQRQVMMAEIEEERACYKQWEQQDLALQDAIVHAQQLLERTLADYQQLTLQEQHIAIKMATNLELYQEQFTESLDDMLLPLTSDDLGHLEKTLHDLQDKIKKLGAINLLAIEEYEEHQARKTYLDQQYQDIESAIAMLEEAIKKMDTETEVRLSETFLAINEGFQRLFPRLFGGGHAQLRTTCDTLLESDIFVMAQPPGKKNSTIQLLSGGEKAMTAIALLFSMFQLNPAPFCLLDEVDASLDDANLNQFCDLVKEMSQWVQFLFITHHKRTMELALQLIGVTMREPGVSRIVAVDVESALSIASQE